MKLKTTLLGKTYLFRDIKQVLAKANEEKTGDKLAGPGADCRQGGAVRPDAGGLAGESGGAL